MTVRLSEEVAVVDPLVISASNAVSQGCSCHTSEEENPDHVTLGGFAAM